MSKNLKWKGILILVGIIIAASYLLPSVRPSPSQKMAEKLENALKAEEILYGTVSTVDRDQIFVSALNPENRDRLDKLVRGRFDDLDEMSEEVNQAGATVHYRIDLGDEWWRKALPGEVIRLGLDLQGGIHLILEVQTDKALESTAGRLAMDLRRTLKKEDIFFETVERVSGDRVQVRGLDSDDQTRLDAIIESQFPFEQIGDSVATEKGLDLRYRFTSDYEKYVRENSVRQGLETIRNRIDQYGVSEPTIQRQGEQRILIQLPGIEDPQRAIELIGKTALLEFKIVDDEHKLEDALAGTGPAGSVVMYQRSKPEPGKKTIKKPYLLKEKTLMTGDSLSDAQVRIDTQFNEPYIAIKFNKSGAKLFDDIAAANVGKQLAIILDNNVYSAPVIKQAHYGGNAIIEGRFTTEEARDLAIVLRAGSLPAPVEILEKRAVGPSLGQDSIDKGIISIIIGGICVIAFMIVYYRTGGLIADFALMFNMLLIMATLTGFKATLTLPGIAGLVLTIGMAVDANVIIFERIREELRVGKTPRAAVDAGYSKALLTILDANITTMIAALVLFQFGTGPIKGFAVTLSIGIFWSVITAVFFTRTIFDYLLMVRKVSTVNI